MAAQREAESRDTELIVSTAPASSVKSARDAVYSIVESLAPTEKEELAKQLGHESVENMVDASAVVTLADWSLWCLTRDRFGNWAAWNLYAIGAPSYVGQETA